MQTFANNLRAARRRAGLTLKELSDKTGVSVGSIGNYETGKRGIGVAAMRRIAETLQLKVADIEPIPNAEKTAGLSHGPEQSQPFLKSREKGPQWNVPCTNVIGSCNYPAESKMPERLAAMETELRAMRTQMDTLVGLLGVALRTGIDKQAKQG